MFTVFMKNRLFDLESLDKKTDEKPLKFLPPFNLTFAAGALLLVVLTALAAWYFHWEDLHTYYTAGKSLLNGRVDLYAPDFADSRIMDYRYPPFFLILFAPLSLLPYGVVKFIWLWLNIIAVYLTVLALRRGFEMVNGKTARLSLILLLAFAIPAKYFFMLFQHFNAHLLIVGMVCGAFYLLIKRKWIAAAMLMALAITFKIVPVLTLPYFVLKKRWKFLWATALFIVVFNLLPALYFGASLNFQLLKDWSDHVMVNNEFHETNGPINLSLKGQIERLTVEIDYSKRIEDREYKNVNIVDLTENQAGQIWKVTAFLMFAATFFLIWFGSNLRKRDAGEAFDFLAYYEFGLIICTALLVEPRTNGYYLTLLVLPLVPLLHSVFRKTSKLNLAALFLVILATIILPLVPGRHTQRYLLVWGVDVYATLILWLALAYNLIRESLTERGDFRKIETGK